MKKKILYITQNGVTDHIGQSQVVPYLLGLAQSGYALHVLSAEKKYRDELIATYQKSFADAGIEWSWIRYHNSPPLVGTLYDLFRMYRKALSIVKREAISLVHCRSYFPALIGYYLKKSHCVKFIFDFRDFYADGGLVNKPFKFVYRYLKKIEGPMIISADKVICLTKKAEGILSSWYLKNLDNPASRFQIIPCCADFTHFDVRNLSAADRMSAMNRANLEDGSFVLLYLGSLGPDYLLAEMIALFRQVLTVRPDACFLFVSNNGRDLVDAECNAQGIALDRIRFLSVERKDIPAFISLADLSVVFIRADLSKAGCSPTKLAELFACNVPVIANAGVGDLDSILNEQRNGSVTVPDFRDETFRAAVEKVLAIRERGTVSIRENSFEFGLEEGVSRYASVYQQLLNE